MPGRGGKAGWGCLPAKDLFEILVKLLGSFLVVFFLGLFFFNDLFGGVGKEVGVGQFLGCPFQEVLQVLQLAFEALFLNIDFDQPPHRDENIGAGK